MDEDFIFQVTEEDLAQFPEEEGIEKEQKEGSKSPIEPVQKVGEENYCAEGKSKYPFPVGFEATQIVCYQQKWPL